MRTCDGWAIYDDLLKALRKQRTALEDGDLVSAHKALQVMQARLTVAKRLLEAEAMRQAEGQQRAGN